MKDSELLIALADVISTHQYTQDIDRAYVWLMRLAAKLRACEECGCWDKRADPRDGIMGVK